MKLIYLTKGYSTHDHRFLKALSATGNSVYYLPLEGHGRSRAERDVPAGVKITEALSNAESIQWSMYPGLVRALRHRIDQIKPDLIHSGPIHLGTTLAALAGFHPLVGMSWGSDLLREAQKPIVALAARYALSRCDAFVGDCRAVRQAALRLGMPEERIVVFPWGIDLNHFSPASTSPLREQLGWEECFVLLSTRSFEPAYGVREILEGFLTLAHSEPNLRLLLLGEGSDRRKLEQRLVRSGMADRVHFAGVVDQETLPAYYHASNLYLSGSHSDGSSVSLLEAMGCGLPVLVSNIPGNSEWVEPGVNGWTFEVGSIKSLVKKLRAILQSKPSLKSVGMSGRRVVEQRANWTENFPRLLKAYEIALQHARKS